MIADEYHRMLFEQKNQVEEELISVKNRSPKAFAKAYDARMAKRRSPCLEENRGTCPAKNLRLDLMQAYRLLHEESQIEIMLRIP